MSNTSRRFNIGDKVVFNKDGYESERLVEDRGIENLNNDVLTVVYVHERGDIDFDKKVFTTDTSAKVWPPHLFEYSKSHIINQILSEI